MLICTGSDRRETNELSYMPCVLNSLRSLRLGERRERKRAAQADRLFSPGGPLPSADKR